MASSDGGSPVAPPMPDSTDAAPAPPTSARAFIAPVHHSVLDRTEAQRVQEFRYRFGQATVFGLPVLALQWFGRSLGGPESGLWVALLQGLLAGWVVYVGATGMLVEAGMIISTRRRMPPAIGLDGLIAGSCAGVYLFSLVRPIGLLVRARFEWPAGFHWCVLTLAAWSALRWAGMSRLAARK
jgi:hypothetical protein